MGLLLVSYIKCYIYENKNHTFSERQLFIRMVFIMFKYKWTFLIILSIVFLIPCQDVAAFDTAQAIVH